MGAEWTLGDYRTLAHVREVIAERRRMQEEIDGLRAYWLIERNDGPWWWCGRGGVWTRDAQEAVRFCREADAKAALTTLRHGLESGDGAYALSVTEHMDVPPKAAT